MTKRHVGIVALAAVVATLTSCLAIPDEPEVPAEPTAVLSPDDGETVEAIPEFVPDGSAQDNLPYIDWVLTKAGAGSGLLGSLDAVAALEEAGFTRENMEVTSDRTKLELAAESTTIVVIIDGECAMGQWSNSWYSSSVEPLLASGTCLLGDTLSLD